LWWWWRIAIGKQWNVRKRRHLVRRIRITKHSGIIHYIRKPFSKFRIEHNRITVGVRGQLRHNRITVGVRGQPRHNRHG
jgi:hypothetical protein